LPLSGDASEHGKEEETGERRGKKGRRARREGEDRRYSGRSSSRYILLVLLNEGPQSLGELEHKTAPMAYYLRSPRNHRDSDVIAPPGEPKTIEDSCGWLMEEGLIRLNGEKYELTEEGRLRAEHRAARLKKGAEVLESQILAPAAAARNTIFAYLFLAAAKLLVGFMSGSIGLIADGADTAVDTASTFAVWLSLRSKREAAGTLVTVMLMFVTVVLIGYDSGTAIFDFFKGKVIPISSPFLVIAVEGVSLVSLLIISYYQRFIGRRGRSLALISRSIDSRNSVYSAAAVIAGAAFSLGGVYWVDAVVGGIIAARIAVDGCQLLVDTLEYMRGKEPDFTKYKLPFEERVKQYRAENLRDWVLYVMRENGPGTKGEILEEMKEVLVPRYIPALFGELALGIGGGGNLERDFDDLVKPLVDEGYLAVEEGGGRFRLTREGEDYARTIFKNRGNRQGSK
jgi:Co/Zn/Cd efflux system component